MNILNIFSKKRKDKVVEIPVPLPEPGLVERPEMLGEIPMIKPLDIDREVSLQDISLTPFSHPFSQAEVETEKSRMNVEGIEQKPINIPAVKLMPIKPIFVAVEDYEKILNSSNLIRAKLSEADEIIARIEELKRQETSYFEAWREQLEGAEKRLTYIDKIIAKGEE